MFKFILGFATCFYMTKHNHQLQQILRDAIAKLELKQDILKHDNPELRDPSEGDLS